MTGFAKYFENIKKTMSFKVIDKKLLGKYTKIWEKRSSLINKKLGSELFYGGSDIYMKTKIKSYGNKINTNFQGKKNTRRKCITKMFVIDNTRFCY